jgi:N-acyl-D-amino-acid deacylase
MDAGACGWSAQRMKPTGPAAVQRDYDGTPMPTDVMHDETCREFARVLAERNEGFMQMLLISGDNAADRAFYEELSSLERPADDHERDPGLRSPPGDPSPSAWPG